jgi:hypothetical protein
MLVQFHPELLLLLLLKWTHSSTQSANICMSGRGQNLRWNNL